MAKRNFSPKRNAIYNAVCSTNTHPSSRWIYEKLKPDIPDLSLGTVYRNISLFKEEGKINVVCSINGEERLDGNTQSHPHFVCNKCGRVVDVAEAIGAIDENKELIRSGYVIQSKYLIYYGMCPECSADGE